MAIGGIGSAAVSYDNDYYANIQKTGNNSNVPVRECVAQGENAVSLRSDALMSYASPQTGESVNIYYAKGYSKDNPVYILKGLDANGNEFEQEVDASKIDPNHCSYNELMILNQETGHTSPSDYLHAVAMRDKTGAGSYFEQTDYMAAAKSYMNDLKTVGDYAGYMAFDKWIQNIMDYVSKYTKNQSQDDSTTVNESKTEQSTGKTHVIDRLLNGNKETAPYSQLADNGVIVYNGVTFICNSQDNTLNLGDTSNPNDCLRIPLSGGGSLIVNRDNMSDLSRSIGMFSPEDVNRIMRAIAQDNKAQEKLNEIDEDKNSIGDSDSNVDALVTDSTTCTYPAQNSDEEKTWYITMYTQDGISCTGGKAGAMKDMWKMDFTDSDQYQKVMDFIDKFDKEDNLTFANHKNCWEDFISGKINEPEFLTFFDKTNNGLIDDSNSGYSEYSQYFDTVDVN